MDISLPCSATQAQAHQTASHTEMPSIPSRLIFRNFPLLSLPTHAHIFFIKQVVFKVLKVLAAINIQTHLDINLGGQGMVITNQMVAIQPCFQQAKHMQFFKTGQ